MQNLDSDNWSNLMSKLAVKRLKPVDIWNNFWLDLKKRVPDAYLRVPSYDFDYCQKSNYLVDLMSYYVILNREDHSDFHERMVVTKVTPMLYDLFVGLVNMGYPMQKDLILYAWISNWKDVENFLTNLDLRPDLRFNISCYSRDAYPTYEVFKRKLKDCKTKEQACELLRSYKHVHYIDCILNNFNEKKSADNNFRQLVPFWDAVRISEIPDFVLEAFIDVGWNINETVQLENSYITNVLYWAFYRCRYRIVHLLLKAGAQCERYYINCDKYHQKPDENMPYLHKEQDYFGKYHSAQYYIDFAIYIEYILGRGLISKKKVMHIKYAQTIMHWFRRIKTFELIVLCSRTNKTNKTNIFSMLNKDVILVIRGYLVTNPFL